MLHVQKTIKCVSKESNLWSRSFKYLVYVFLAKQCFFYRMCASHVVDVGRCFFLTTVTHGSNRKMVVGEVLGISGWTTGKPMQEVICIIFFNDNFFYYLKSFAALMRLTNVLEAEVIVGLVELLEELLVALELFESSLGLPCFTLTWALRLSDLV